MNKLAIVACHFNPAGFELCTRHFHTFAEQMNRSDLLFFAVELVFGNAKPDLSGVPCTDLLTVRGGDVLWQKERLLNIGIERALATGARAVGWFDADVVFRDRDWSLRINRALEKYQVIQPFTLATLRYTDTTSRRRPLVARVNGPRSTTPGLAWVARADVLRRCGGLYDSCILGGGDRANAAGFRGMGADEVRHEPMFEGLPRVLVEHWQSWAEGVPPGLSVGFAPIELGTLSHGSYANRRYRQRHMTLKSFNPFEDIKHGPEGAWVWASRKPELHREVADYFPSRREDDEEGRHV